MEFASTFTTSLSDSSGRSSSYMISVVDVTSLLRLLLGDSSERLKMRSLTRVAVVEEGGFAVEEAIDLSS